MIRYTVKWSLAKTGSRKGGGDMEPIKGLANKLAEHAARIAGVLTLVELSVVR